jgi:hypothetical protein
MRDLYDPATHFDRVDALYLDLGLLPGRAKARAISRHPKLWLKVNARLLVEAMAIFTQLMRHVADPVLRREYRRRMLRAALRARRAIIVQRYAIKCAMHFHAYRMVQEMSSHPQLRTVVAT